MIDASSQIERYVNGYKVCEYVALTEKAKTPVSLYSNIYSTESDSFVSENEETKLVLDKLAQHTEEDKKQFTSIDERLDLIHGTVKNIERILVGEDNFKRKGLVEMVDAHENLIKKAAWTMGIIMAIGSLLGFVVSKL